MGKNKANRTKGNTRPSSSGRSAQLLTSSGKSFSRFVGFDALDKDIPSYIPVTGQHSSDADLSVDSNLRMVMRKMLKKDNVTRLKAIQEFGDLCSVKEKDVVKNVLSFWPHLFNKLALDYDRRIREATHQANGKLIANVKREIAPYLKNIMGVWLLGQNDLHAPAASAAQTSFVATFPSPKQSEALMYCKNEIFSYFKDNLFEQTAKSLSENNPASAEDIENKYTLVISATLQAMKFFLATISSNEISNVQAQYLSILSENKFWKFAKSKEAQIRGSWYALISYLCNKKPDLFNEMEKKLAAAVFGSLAENEPVVAPHVWESALHVVTNFDNCWQGISIHKVVLPQLWALLNEGGRGNAHVLYPCILPFLSKFPKEVISKDAFSLQLCSSLRNSLILDSVKLSSKECESIFSTFIECLQYFSFHVLDQTKEGPALLEKVISDHILPLIEASFYDTRYRHIAASKFYSCVGSLIQKIENRCLNESEEVSRCYSQILTLFWNDVFAILKKFFDKKEDDKPKIVCFISFFFHCIFTFAPAVVKSKKSKVKFEDEENQETTQAVVSPYNLQSVELYTKLPITFKQIISFINYLCKRNDEKFDIYNLRFLCDILAGTLSPNFLSDILKSYVNTDCSEMTSMKFFNEIILGWISNADFDKTNMNSIVDIIFSLCSSVSDKEMLEMLNTCCQVRNPVLLESILASHLELPTSTPCQVLFQNWLRNPEFIDSILNGMKIMMENLIQDEVESNQAKVLAQKNLLFICLINERIQEIFKENNCIEKILMICKEYIDQGLKCRNVDYFFEVTCCIIQTVIENFDVCWKYPDTDSLLSLLFHWRLNAEKCELSEQTCTIMSECWHSALMSSCKSSNEMISKNGFVLNAAKELNILLNQSSKQSQNIQTEIQKLLHSVKEAQTSLHGIDLSTSILSELLDNILPSISQWENLKKDLVLSLLPSFLEESIFYPVPKEENVMISKEVLINLFMTTKVILELFLKEIEVYHSCEGEKYFDQHIVKHMPDLLWSISYFNGNGYLSEDFETHLFAVDVLEENCVKILKYLPGEKEEDILKKVFYGSMSNDINWLFSCQYLLGIVKMLHPESLPVSIDLTSDGNLMESKNGDLSLILQILSSHIFDLSKVSYVRKMLRAYFEEHNKEPKVITQEHLKKLAQVCCFIRKGKEYNHQLHDLLLKFIQTMSNYICEEDLELSFTFYMTSLLSSVINSISEIITIEIWKYLLSLLSSSIKACKCLKFNKSLNLISLFQVSSLYAVAYFFTKKKKRKEFLECNAVIPDDISEEFLFLFIHVGGIIKKYKPLPRAFRNAINELLFAVKFIPDETVFKCVMQSSFTTEKPSASSEEGKTLETPFESLLRILSVSDIPHLQLGAHLVLMKTMPLLAKSLENVSKNEVDDNEDEDEKVPSKLLPLVDVLNLLNDLMEAMLWDFKIGDCCLVVPNTEAYTFVSAYLFAWLNMLEFISSSPSQLRSGYVADLEETKLLSALFSNVCRLMPENPMSCLKKAPVLETPKKENLLSVFFRLPKLSADKPSSEVIQHIACFVFCTAMRKVPASVRTWFNNLDKKSSDIVNRFTSKYISGLICAEEIQAVQNNENLFKNMVVKARLGSREVIATYTVDDFTIELCVQLPTNYPLGPIVAEKRGKIVVSQQELRNWLMQLTTVLTYQNGSILDGLNIWKKNLDKKFEGVEECMICYYVLHSSSLKLPKLSCHVCKKKFHHACLYKWFHSSNNFTCPLCRNEFVI